ncbi:hypothetical protein GUITHDRAFT_146133 [Guillardia theta CCMP2712]|uniref:Uncharacterized protein n=1 Tax=Guillardia theta (strain CCMP2712) TaxID=905079 RepID=L1IJJ9_GUITC|nr:hypothetical protein GUITHDRAFT_146133 [Guillardia theta CCMP2712]EKX35990.1 hypothetical protein GUITHDRAFT_146133 [Guillardia theta CCMP2712]|eukprot:XP_005822970.1 hypothetical protein GUITHDRAFT_146133 [Guillardia theta CCMP2712]
MSSYPPRSHVGLEPRLHAVLSRSSKDAASLRRPDPHPARDGSLTLGLRGASQNIQELKLQVSRDLNTRKEMIEALNAEEKAKREADYQKRLAQWHRNRMPRADGMHIDEYEKWCKTSESSSFSKAVVKNSIGAGKGQPVVKTAKRGRGIKSRTA